MASAPGAISASEAALFALCIVGIAFQVLVFVTLARRVRQKRNSG